MLLLAGAALAQIGGPIALGDLPDGKKVRVHFDVTVDTGLGPLVMGIANQGTVASSTMAFGPVPTDDPADGTSEVDFTVTPLDGLTIGNLVWNEKTGSSVFDPATADVGVNGVLVHLYADDGDGVLDAGDGVPIATTTTAGGGLYSFAGVQPGDYIVEIPACNFVVAAPCATAPLAGLATLSGAPDPDNDVDNDDNGADVAGFGVASSALTLSLGGETLGDEDGDSDADTNLTLDFGFNEVVDLALDKSDDGTNAVAGSTYVYTLAVTNSGPGASSGSTVTDTLPSGWTYVSSTGTCVGDGMSPVETVTCTVGMIAPAGMASFDITAMVPASAAAGTVTNSASVAGAQSDPTAGNNGDSEMTTVVRATDLELDKSDSGADAVAGDTYDYTLKVTNNGPSNSTGGTVSDTLPAGWTFVSATGGTCVATPAGFDCAVGALADGAMQTFTATVSVPASAAAGTVTNSATVVANETDPTAANDTAIAMTPVVREVDVVVSKTESGDPVVAGGGLPGNLTYVVTVENTGPSDISGLSLSEDLTLPAPDVSVDSITPSGGGFVTTTAPDGLWTLDLPASATETLTVVISVGPTAPFGIDTISSTATVTGSTGSETLVNIGDDSATESTTISTSPLAFEKVFAPDTIGEGFETTLTFTIDNTMSGLAADDLAFVDVLPPMLRVADTPNVVNACAGTVTAPAGSTSIELSGGTVAGLGSCELSVSVFAPSTGVLVNTSGNLTSSTGNSGPATDTLTVVGCAAADGSNLTLGSYVVLVPETYEVCNTIEVEQDLQVLGPTGILELRAGVAVVFFNGVEVAQDGGLQVVIDPTLVP